MPNSILKHVAVVAAAASASYFLFGCSSDEEQAEEDADEVVRKYAKLGKGTWDKYEEVIQTYKGQPSYYVKKQCDAVDEGATKLIKSLQEKLAKAAEKMKGTEDYEIEMLKKNSHEIFG